MKPVVRIAELTTMHGDSFVNCKGCAICKKIEKLRPFISKPPEERYKHLLDKGEDMTKTDIQTLINADVGRDTIRKKLKMGTTNFYLMLKGWGLTENNEVKERVNMAAKQSMTKEKFSQYEGVALKEIAKQEGVTVATVYNWKNKFSSKEKSDAEKQYDQVKKEVVAALETDSSLVEKLQAKITGLEQELAGKNQRVEELEKANEAKVQWITDLEDELQQTKDTNENLKITVRELTDVIGNLKERSDSTLNYKEKINNLMADLGEWKDKAHNYARENELMNSTNRQLKAMMEEQNRKAIVFASALKEAL